MIQFIFGVFIGANLGLIIFALLLANKTIDT